MQPLTHDVRHLFDGKTKEEKRGSTNERIETAGDRERRSEDAGRPCACFLKGKETKGALANVAVAIAMKAASCSSIETSFARSGHCYA
jgi:hypothetical protein